MLLHALMLSSALAAGRAATQQSKAEDFVVTGRNNADPQKAEPLKIPRNFCLAVVHKSPTSAAWAFGPDEEHLLVVGGLLKIRDEKDFRIYAGSSPDGDVRMEIKRDMKTGFVTVVASDYTGQLNKRVVFAVINAKEEALPTDLAQSIAAAQEAAEKR